MQLKVEKADGTMEIYLHTKVMGSIAVGLSEAGEYDSEVTEQLAESVTTYLVKRYGKMSVPSDEIHALIEAVLCETGYGKAALALHEHRIRRFLKRSRIDVIGRLEDYCSNGRVGSTEGVESAVSAGAAVGVEPVESSGRPLSGKRRGGESMAEYFVVPWNKSRIVRTLEQGYGLEHCQARAVAGEVEEKALSMNASRLTTSLIRELVRNECLAMQWPLESVAAGFERGPDAVGKDAEVSRGASRRGKAAARVSASDASAEALASAGVA